MELKDRIANIKAILPYCSRRSDQVPIVVREVGEFFADFFKNDGRFRTPKYDVVYPRINEGLYDGSIDIEYCYDADRDGEYWETYPFYDEEVASKNPSLSRRTAIRYSEIPDSIWAIIQEKLYENAMKTTTDDLLSAASAVETYTKILIEFNNIKLLG